MLGFQPAPSAQDDNRPMMEIGFGAKGWEREPGRGIMG